MSKVNDALTELAGLEWSRCETVNSNPLQFRGVLAGKPRRIIAASDDEHGVRQLMNMAVDMAFGRA